MNRLKEMGVVETVTLFPHPCLDLKRPCEGPAARRSGGERRVIASYGFFLPTKGLLELVDAFRLLVERGLDGELLLVNAEYPASVSRDAIAQCRARIVEAGLAGRVRLVTGCL